MENLTRVLIGNLWSRWLRNPIVGLVRVTAYMRHIRCELLAEADDPEIIALFREVTRR